MKTFLFLQTDSLSHVPHGETNTECYRYISKCNQNTFQAHLQMFYLLFQMLGYQTTSPLLTFKDCFEKPLHGENNTLEGIEQNPERSIFARHKLYLPTQVYSLPLLTTPFFSSGSAGRLGDVLACITAQIKCSL